MSESEQCIFCLISQGKIQAAKVYEDEDLIAFLDIRPATQGHIQVISKQHAPLINMLPPEIKNKIFNIALSIGNNLIQKLGSTGVSYLINEGSGAGQRIAHASIQVIPRYENDGVTIGWEEKQLSQEEINSYLTGVIKKLQSEGQAPQKQEVKPVEKVEKEETKSEEKIEEMQERVPKYW